jgi:hypothetical protein
MVALRDHRLRVGDRHRTGFRDVVDLNLDASRDLRMSDQLDDRHDLNLDVNLCHRMSDLLVDRKLDDVRHGLTMGDDLMTGVNLCHRMNDLLGDRHDQNWGVTMDVSHDLRKNDRLVDQNLDVSHANRNYARRDRSLGVMMDVNLCHRKNDLLVDRNLDGMTDGNLCHRMNDLLDDLMTGVSRVNHKYVRRDLNLVAKMDGKSHHVK